MEVSLLVAEQVTGGGFVSNDYTPPAGKETVIKLFVGSAAFSPNAVCAVIWKYQHATEAEEVVWSTKGVSNMPYTKILDASVVDGIRKIGIICDNGESGPLYLSAYAEISVKD